jgi:hypothetical protein
MYKEVVSTTLWAAWAFTSIVVALAGPFGTFETKTFLWRLSYWSTLIAVAILIAIFLRTLWRHVLVSRPEWQEDALVAASLALVFGPMIVVLNRQIGGLEAQVALGYGGAIGCLFAIAVGTIALRRALSRPLHTVPPIVRRDRLFERISANPNVRLSRISSDNHHIRIITDDGQEHRVLMRLRDAVLETDVEEGFCVHRSHWVARARVAGLKKVAGREVVVLTCGVDLPVGPKYRANLDFAKTLSE